VTAGFRGGRSVLTFVGGAVVFAPVPAAAAIGLCAGTTVATRRFDVGARVSVAAFPLIQLALQGRYRTAATGVLMTFIGLRFAQAAASARRTAAPATADA
jgi:glycerol-3-phosphate acyltransferase PlsY